MTNKKVFVVKLEDNRTDEVSEIYIEATPEYAEKLSERIAEKFDATIIYIEQLVSLYINTGATTGKFMDVTFKDQDER